MYESHEVGILGEKLATEFLIKSNYEIIKRNFKCKIGEIDIIAKDIKKNELVFVEVKTRTCKKYGTPGEAVNKTKQKHIYKTAQYYLYINKIKNEYTRIDVIEIFYKKDKNYKINHLKQII